MSEAKKTYLIYGFRATDASEMLYALGTGVRVFTRKASIEPSGIVHYIYTAKQEIHESSPARVDDLTLASERDLGLARTAATKIGVPHRDIGWYIVVGSDK